jgi:pyridoxal 5'-phosphate synthase pdxT subunit
MKIGVLGLQGDVPEHLAALREAVGGARGTEVRSRSDLASVDALVLPGGESTTIADLLKESGLWDPLRERISRGLPVLATCAGLILLATRLDPVPGGRDPPTLGVLEIEVRRNEYGAQRESFEAPVNVSPLRGGPFPGVFIRAPRIHSVSGTTKVIARWGEEVVGVQRGRVVGLTFHPELAGDPRLLEWFLREAARAPQPRTQSKAAKRTSAAVRTRPTRSQRR